MKHYWDAEEQEVTCLENLAIWPVPSATLPVPSRQHLEWKVEMGQNDRSNTLLSRPPSPLEQSCQRCQDEPLTHRICVSSVLLKHYIIFSVPYIRYCVFETPLCPKCAWFFLKKCVVCFGKPYTDFYSHFSWADAHFSLSPKNHPSPKLEVMLPGLKKLTRGCRGVFGIKMGNIPLCAR